MVGSSAVGGDGSGPVKRGPGRPKGSKTGSGQTAAGKPVVKKPSAPALAKGEKMSPEDAEAQAEVIMSITDPVYDQVTDAFRRRPLSDEERMRQFNAWRNYGIRRGDVLGEWGPEIMLASALLLPLGQRFREPPMPREIPPPPPGPGETLPPPPPGGQTVQ